MNNQEPMKQRYKVKLRFRDELIFNDDVDFIGKTKRDYKNSKGNKPMWRAKRKRQRLQKRVGDISGKTREYVRTC